MLLFQVEMNLDNTVFDAKRLIGRRFDDATVQSDMKLWPFNVVSDGGKPKIRVEYKSETKTFFPEEISSMVLVKMKEIAEAYLGKVCTVSDFIHHSFTLSFLFCKSFPLWSFFSAYRLTPRIPPGLITDTSEHIHFYFLVFPFSHLLVFGSVR